MRKIKTGLNLTLILIISISCSGINKKLKEDYITLKSAKIIVPNDLRIMVKGKDSIINDFFDCESKMIVYIDSTSCNSCHVKSLIDWKVLMKQVSIIDNKFRFYFIFRPKKDEVNSIKITLLSLDFNYPVILDEEGKFRKANPALSTNKLLHTFLLDKNNHVILIGDPIGNLEINKLFLTLIGSTSN